MNWKTQNDIVLKLTLNRLAKWFSVRLRTKWFWVRAQLQPLKKVDLPQISIAWNLLYSLNFSLSLNVIIFFVENLKLFISSLIFQLLNLVNFLKHVYLFIWLFCCFCIKWISAKPYVLYFYQIFDSIYKTFHIQLTL